jgi:hypothetical protein
VRHPHHMLRWGQLLVIGLFLGSVFTRLPLTVDSIRLFWGLTNLQLWCILFVIGTSAPTFCTSFTITLQEFSNGAFGIPTHTAAQFVTGVPFNFVSALVFSSVFHWMVGMHDTLEAFAFTVLMAFVLLECMEVLVVISAELLREGGMTTSMASTIAGAVQVFAWAKSASKAVSYLTNVDPAWFALAGMALNTFHGQVYEATDGSGSGSVDGNQIPSTILLYKDMYNKWAYIGIVALFLFVYLCLHLLLRFRKTMRVNISADAMKVGGDEGTGDEGDGALTTEEEGESARSSQGSAAASSGGRLESGDGDLEELKDIEHGRVSFAMEESLV